MSIIFHPLTDEQQERLRHSALNLLQNRHLYILGDVKLPVPKTYREELRDDLREMRRITDSMKPSDE